MDCRRCLSTTDEIIREAWSCGFLSESSWTGRPPIPRGYPGVPSICPGYLISMPVVNEACDAKFWAEKGSLRDRYGTEPLTERVFEAVTQLETACQAVERYEFKRLSDK